MSSSVDFTGEQRRTFVLLSVISQQRRCGRKASWVSPKSRVVVAEEFLRMPCRDVAWVKENFMYVPFMILSP